MSKIVAVWQDSQEAPVSFYSLLGRILAVVSRQSPDAEGKVQWLAQVYTTREQAIRPTLAEAKKWAEVNFEQHRHTTEDYLTVEGVCPVTAKPWAVRVRREGYDAWKGGQTIQKALPELTPDEREALITGLSPEGYEIVFGRDEGQTEQVEQDS